VLSPRRKIQKKGQDSPTETKKVKIPVIFSLKMLIGHFKNTVRMLDQKSQTDVSIYEKNPLKSARDDYTYTFVYCIISTV
jgi:hypothetical protein